MNPLRVGQHWPVDPVELRDALGGIVQRGFYANNGPLVRGLDGEFGGRHGAAGAVAFGSAALATMCAARALSLDGVVLAPITAPLALLQGLAWGGASVALLDVAPEGENIDPALLESWDGPVAGVAVTRSSTEPELSPALLALATARGASVLVDATHALGCRVRGDAVGSEGP
ncbi:MAG: DegT/DnrJ/EryC1/StrS family aminotransferase, partial [Myxococcota bacterium]|nr:DegT/DnrJ/EryC1/StrS family aminotransferase [Myxococcota bacterium]